MIGKLKGLLEEVAEDHLLIDVGGVGYLVFASARTLGRLPGKGEAFALLIDTHVREDHIHLYGFLERAEREWFRLLLTVQGVGARHALAILSVLDPAELSTAIMAQDKAAVSRANGVGPKLAQRVVHELKEKAGRLAVTAEFSPAATGGGAELAPAATGDAVDALVALGYRRSEAFTAVGKAAAELGEAAGVEALIKSGLQELAR
ncbi:Holliday junction branch migration protein RuvA [Aquibaculum sediminis]|uniref:Holliday junction branch migration protein RuvA n=1 Tax=Aquibaculum sediminis TaxID=3231907 RepID=UPI0034555525